MYFDARITGRWMRPDLVCRLQSRLAIATHHHHCCTSTSRQSRLRKTNKGSSARSISLPNNQRSIQARCFQLFRQRCSASQGIATTYDGHLTAVLGVTSRRQSLRVSQASNRRKEKLAATAPNTSTAFDTPSSEPVLLCDDEASAVALEAQVNYDTKYRLYSEDAETAAKSRDQHLPQGESTPARKSHSTKPSARTKSHTAFPRDQLVKDVSEAPKSEAQERRGRPEPSSKKPTGSALSHKQDSDSRFKKTYNDTRLVAEAQGKASLSQGKKTASDSQSPRSKSSKFKRDLQFDYCITETPEIPQHGSLINSTSKDVENLKRRFAASIGYIVKEYRKDGNVLRVRSLAPSVVKRAETVWMTRQYSDIQQWLSLRIKGRNRAQDLDHLLVGSLLISPQRMLEVLQALCVIHHDFEIRSHCLAVMGWLYREEIAADTQLNEQYEYEIRKLRPRTRWPARFRNLSHIRLLLWKTPVADRSKLLQDIENHIRDFYQHDSKPPAMTLLWLTMFCAKKANLPDQGFAFFSMLPDSFLRQPQPLLLKCCYVLLKHDYVITTASGQEFKFLTPLLMRGLAITSRLYDVIIHRCLQSKHYIVAWDVYHQLQASSQSTMWYTHLQMLRHAFLTNDSSKINLLLSLITEALRLHPNQTLAGHMMNVIRRLTHTSRTWSTNHGVEQILNLHDRMFRRDQLKKFGVDLKEASTASALMNDPNPHKLAYTVWAIILCHRDGQEVEPMWQAILKHVEQGDETVIACMRYDLIYNAFIWLHSKHSNTTAQSLRILRHMLANVFCPPSPRTWTLVLAGFLQHNQIEPTRQLYTLAKRHGFDLSKIHMELIADGVDLDSLQPGRTIVGTKDTVDAAGNDVVDQYWLSTDGSKQNRDMADYKLQLEDYTAFSTIDSAREEQAHPLVLEDVAIFSGS